MPAESRPVRKRKHPSGHWIPDTPGVWKVVSKGLTEAGEVVTNTTRYDVFWKLGGLVFCRIGSGAEFSVREQRAKKDWEWDRHFSDGEDPGDGSEPGQETGGTDFRLELICEEVPVVLTGKVKIEM